MGMYFQRGMSLKHSFWVDHRAYGNDTRLNTVLQSPNHLQSRWLEVSP